MRAAVIIAAKDLRQRIRDRSALIIGVIAPLGLAFIFNLILGGIDGDGLDLRYGVVDLDGGPVAASFVDALTELETDGVLSIETVSTVDAGERMIEGDEVVALFVLPADLTTNVTAGEASTVTIIGDVDAPTSVGIASSIAEAFAGEIRTVQLSVTAAFAAGSTKSVDELTAAAATTPAPVTIAASETVRRELDLKTFFAAGMAIFFLFFTVQTGVTGLLDEKTQGTLSRLRGAPISRSSILAGKALVSITLGLTSMATLVIASTLLMGASWGDSWAVAALSVAAVLSAVGILALVAAFASTAEQAGNLQSIFGVALGMLGGIFFPGALGDGVFATLANISPHKWFMSGLADLAGGGGVATVLPAIGVLVAFFVVTTLLAYPRLRKGLLA